ncbi:MAG: Rpn family recombination-promoting nuclease/putative transposase [Lachnospiraceae bacterium]|nr:Rpn family recombination-promoting nuclease/putative transposase [Lachnospiraceae bacterium]
MNKKDKIKEIQENTKAQKQDTDNPHDKGYKRIFSIKKNFLDFIKKYIAFDWMMDLTEKDLVLIDKEFITDQFDTYESDLVYKVNTKKGSVYLFFLLELQSYNDFTMPFRLLVYITAILLDYFKNCDKDARRKQAFRLPAVIPIVLHNGERSWTASRHFKEMIDKAELFGNYIIDFEYVLVSIKNLDISKIRQSNTLVDNIFLADKKRTREEWTENMSELLQRIRQMETEDLNEWITWFSNVIRKLNEEERSTFIEQIRKGDEKFMCSSFERLLMKENEQGRKEGKIEGKIEGEVRGRAQAVIELLEELGEPSDALRKQIMEQKDVKVLSIWLKTAAKSESIAEFEESVGLVQLQ